MTGVPGLPCVPCAHLWAISVTTSHRTAGRSCSKLWNQRIFCFKCFSYCKQFTNYSSNDYGQLTASKKQAIIGGGGKYSFGFRIEIDFSSPPCRRLLVAGWVRLLSTRCNSKELCNVSLNDMLAHENYQCWRRCVCRNTRSSVNALILSAPIPLHEWSQKRGCRQVCACKVTDMVSCLRCFVSACKLSIQAF